MFFLGTATQLVILLKNMFMTSALCLLAPTIMRWVHESILEKCHELMMQNLPNRQMVKNCQATIVLLPK